ncbi:MAG: type I methionyl aminopeptidase, partial [Amphiplicatus sp.]
MFDAETDETTLARTSDIKLHDAAAFEGMRKAGRLAAECLDMLAPLVQPGVASADLDRRAFEFVMDNGALPACIGYKGYRHTTCISLNHVI